MKFLLLNLIAISCFPIVATAQYKIQKATDTQLLRVDRSVINTPAVPSLAPTAGERYCSAYAWRYESPDTGEVFGNFFGWQSVVLESTMNGISEVRGTDFADLVDPDFAPNVIVATESLESLGRDPDTGRFILRLTVALSTTADPSARQWDSFEFDHRDPLDVDGDGETGAGPDGVFGTDDDVIEPDGIFDIGDGVLDAPMPLDPPGLVRAAICEDDGDCAPGGLTYFCPVASLFFVGTLGGASSPIQFDDKAGVVVPLAAYWILEDFKGRFADLDRNGEPGIVGFPGDFDSNGDGIVDGMRTDTFVALETNDDGGWTGEYSLGFQNDGNAETTDDLMSGSLRRIGFVFDLLSDLENEFSFVCGDANLDGSLDVLDVSPFVNLIVNGGYLGEADINGDGIVNVLDINPFVNKLANGG